MTDYKQLKYDGTKVQVESAIRDEEGYSLKGCYAKKTEIKDGTLTINTQGGSTLGTFSANQSTNQTVTLPNGSVQLLNQSVTFVSDNTYEEFPYRATISVTGVASSTYAEVTYSEEQATSLNFATFCDTATDVIYLYSRTNVGTVTIPTISIGMDFSDIVIDSTPISGSGNAISSGAVYTALTDGSVTKIGTSTVGGNLKPVYLNAGVPTAVANDFVTVDTVQTISARKVFAGEMPSSTPTSGHTSTPAEFYFYGGASGVTDFANITVYNKDHQCVCFWGPSQYGTNNSDGGNGYRIGIRDRADTTWKHFLSLSDNGSMSWSGSISATSGFTGNLTGNVTGNVSGSSGSCTGNSATASQSSYAYRLHTTSHRNDCYLDVNWNNTRNIFEARCKRDSNGTLFGLSVMNLTDGDVTMYGAKVMDTGFFTTYPYYHYTRYVEWFCKDIQCRDVNNNAIWIVRFTHQGYNRRIEVCCKGSDGNENWTTLHSINI